MSEFQQDHSVALDKVFRLAVFAELSTFECQVKSSAVGIILLKV